ncbi:hypothetical protein KHC28_14185 [Ancylobacter sonchi]|uniref:hypothetical protein n=1 Tax=Ancylobacter sonchi TaxID=1937790 RepID=UPI001BD4D43D|nr:hypothetical protein [Ancylobacter sonchi]MBS7534808.1 hypothetical protein [Ancylobacter sonchi]
MNAHTSGIYEMADLEEAGYQGLIQQRERLERDLRTVNEAISKYEHIAALKKELASLVTLETAPVVPKRRRNALPPARIAKTAREIILKAGRPLTRYEIAKALEHQGVALVGSDPIKNVGTILWRHRDEFENIPDRGYWPKDVPLEGAHELDKN